MKRFIYALIAFIAVACSTAPPLYAESKDNVFEQAVYADVSDVVSAETSFILSDDLNIPVNDEGESPGGYLFRDIELIEANCISPVVELQTFSNPYNLNDTDAKQLAGHKLNTFPVTIRKL